MTTLQIHLRKTKGSWDRLNEVLVEKRKFNPRLKGANMTMYITNEINSRFRELSIGACSEVKESAKSKRFNLVLSDDVAAKVLCLSNKMGILPGELISRMILDPHLFNH